MKKRRRHDDDEDTVADGGRVRVPMMMRDALPERTFRDADGIETTAADWQIRYVTDCSVAHKLGLDDGFDLHKPGFRFTDSAGNEAKFKAYLQAVQDAQDAWRHPTPDAYGAYPAGAGATEGGACTIDGRPGRLRRQSDGSFVCIPDGNGDGQMDARDAAYEQYVYELTNAWKGSK
jgi:hypothetical protein